MTDPEWIFVRKEIQPWEALKRPSWETKVSQGLSAVTTLPADPRDADSRFRSV